MSLQRRVDTSDPRNPAAIQPFSVPPEWKQKRVSGYITLLSTVWYVVCREYGTQHVLC